MLKLREKFEKKNLKISQGMRENQFEENLGGVSRKFEKNSMNVKCLSIYYINTHRVNFHQILH